MRILCVLCGPTAMIILRAVINRLRGFWDNLVREGQPVNRPRYPRVGGEYTVYIKKMTPDGLGRASIGSFEVFVPRSAPGDLVRATVIEVRGKHAYARLEEVIRPSGLRSEVSCPYYRDCGNCDWDHLKYSYQLRLKREYLKKNLEGRSPGRDLRVSPTRGNEAYEDVFLEAAPFLSARHGLVLLSSKSRDLVSGFSMEKCPRFHPVLRKLLTSLLDHLDEYEIPLLDEEQQDGNGLGRLRLRYFPGTDEAMLIFHVAGEAPPGIFPLVKALVARHPVLGSVQLKKIGGRGMKDEALLLYGRRSVYERRGRFMIEADMDLEPGVQDEEKVHRKLASFVAGGGGVVYYVSEHMHEEMFWVAGAARALYVLGMGRQQRRLLEDNLITNDLYNVNLVEGDVLERVDFLEAKGRADGAVIHTKSEKLERGVLERLAAAGLKRVALVTESAADLARQVDLLVREGYLARQIIPLDAYPQRRGLRCVALLIHHSLWREKMMKRAGAAVFAVALAGLLAFGGKGIFKQDALIATTQGTAWSNPDFRLFLNKDVFLRYEMVEARVELGPSLSAGDVESIFMRVRGDGSKIVKTVGGVVDWPLKRNPDGSFSGFWPIPYHPRLGTYVLEVCVEAARGREVARRREIKVVSRKQRGEPRPLSVMTLETMRNDNYERIPNPVGAGKGYRHVASWGEYMGVDAIWHCVGFSPAWKKNDGGDPWDRPTLEMMRKLGPEIHARGMKYGVWLQAFAMIGGVNPRSQYKHSYAYNRREDRVEAIRHVSLDDEKRVQDIVALVKLLDREPSVDYIGLDYIRTGLGGYELIEDFVREMSVPVSSKWSSLGMDLKMKWLASQLEIERNTVLLEKWNWWRARRTALVVKKIIDQAKPVKPLWTFTLGWRQGKEHGQDPVMMIDAGVSYDAVMLYEASRPTFDRMNEDWARQYLRGETFPLLIGQCVDWDLLQNTTDPPGPQELLRRNVEVIEEWLPYNANLGIFWHDLSRALFGRTGPYTAKEWAIAGGASATRLRQMSGEMGLHLEMIVEEVVDDFDGLRLPVKLVNGGDEAVFDLEVSLLDTQSMDREELTRIKLNMIMPGEEVVMDGLFALADKYQPRGNLTEPQMIAFLVSYPGPDGSRQRDFFARYIKKKDRTDFEHGWSAKQGEDVILLRKENPAE